MSSISPAAEQARIEAGWTKGGNGKWTAPCGTTEETWRQAGYAFPESPLYFDWRQPFSYYEEES